MKGGFENTLEGYTRGAEKIAVCSQSHFEELKTNRMLDFRVVYWKMGIISKCKENKLISFIEELT